MYAVCVQGKFCHVFSSPLYNTVVRLLCWSESSELPPLNVCLLTLCASRNLLVLIPQQCHIYDVLSVKKWKSTPFNLLITLLLAVIALILIINSVCLIYESVVFTKNHLYMYCILFPCK